MRVFNRPGRGGRDVERRLGRYLDDRFTLAHHAKLPGRKNAVDALLVGPHGVTALAVSNDVGRVRCLGDNWYIWDPKHNGFVTARHNPVKKVQGDRAAVEMLLAGREMGSIVPVDSAVMVSNPRTQVEFMQQPAPIVAASKIAEFAAGLASQRELLEWTQADNVLKGLGVPPLGRPWHTLSQSGARARARATRSTLGGLQTWQIIFLVAIAIADLLVLVGGLAVVLLNQ